MSNNICRLLSDIKREVEGFHHFRHAARSHQADGFEHALAETQRLGYLLPSEDGKKWQICSKTSFTIFNLSSNSQSSEGPAKPITGSDGRPSISLLMSNRLSPASGLLSHPGSPEAPSLLTSAADISRDDNGRAASWLIATALCGTGDDSGTRARRPGEGHDC